MSLYNSLNGTAYTDAAMLEFNTLENAIYMGMKNDLSFLIMDQMHLYEHQSTYTPNMPLRDLFYVADLLQKLAVECAIEECIRDNVLREFLMKQKAEVFKMSIYEYDKEREWKLIRADEREIGREEEKEDKVKAIISLCQKYGGKKEDAVDEVVERCSLDKDIAAAKVEFYWKEEG